MFRKTFAEIKLDQLSQNIDLIKSHLAPGTFFCPMVKANAYGHGDVVIAKALEKMKVSALGVCLIEEGLLLRQFGVKAQILVFRGFDLEGARQLVDQELTPVVSDWFQLECLDQVLKSPLKIHLKFDTGMNRLGFSVAEAPAVFEYIQSHKKMQVEGILTHLYQGEDGVDEQGHTFEQLHLFATLREIFKSANPFFHILNSGGFLSQLVQKSKGNKNLLTDFNWGLRPGLMIYGYNPLQDENGFRLKPVMNLKSYVNVFRAVPKGQGVSYNHTWKASRDSVIAVVPIGYADGFHRLLSNKSSVLFQGQRVPLVGQICMDYLMLDVTNLQAAGSRLNPEEKEVVFFGTDSKDQFLSAAEQAKAASTITWEMLTSVGERVPRVYRSENPDFQELL